MVPDVGSAGRRHPVLCEPRTREDPPFTFKTMVVQASWPGATVEEMINQVTDRIRAQARGTELARLHQQLHDPGPDHGFRQPARGHTGDRGSSHLGSGSRQDCRYTGGASLRRTRTILQRSVRRSLWNHLRLYLRRPVVSPAARLRRTGPRRHPEDPDCREGRPDRNPRRGHLPRCVDQADRRAWSRLEFGDLKPPGRKNAVGAVRNRARPGPERVSLRVSGAYASEEACAASIFASMTVSSG